MALIPAPLRHAFAIQAAANDVAMGLLRGDLMVACLDSRASRQAVNEIAFRLGVPWIDLGVLLSLIHI